MSERVLTLAATIGTLVAAITLYFWLSDGGDTSLLKADNRLIVERGKAIYAEHCASCHGAKLEGEKDWRKANPNGTNKAPPHDETGHTWHHADQVLFDLTKYGMAKYLGQPDYKSNMPAYDGTLSDANIVAVLSFIKASWPEPVRKRHDRLNAALKRQ